MAVFTALVTFAVIPWGPDWQVGDYDMTGWVADVPIALVLMFALGSIGIYGFIVGGWASDSKYSLLGSMRTCAQLVSYEVALALSVLGVVLMAGSLSLVDIAEKPSRRRSGSPGRSSSDSSCSSSPASPRRTARRSTCPRPSPSSWRATMTEYGGMRWGLFQLAEYANVLTLSALGITLFFGGWGGPGLPGPIWFVIKLVIAIAVFIWIRATLPRLRYDQLMRFGWKVLLPVATLNALVTAILVVAVD